MTTDLPDYTKRVNINYTGGFMGLEELAVRLGALTPWDLQGNVIHMEDFESEVTEGDLGYSGSGSSSDRSTRHKYSGDWALKLVAGAASGAQASLDRVIYYAGLVKYGVFCRFGWDDSLQDISLECVFNTPDKRLFAYVRYKFPNTTLTAGYRLGTENVLDTSLDIANSTFAWHPLLLVVDLENEVWDKVVIDNTEYDASAYSLESGTKLADPHILIRPIARAMNTTGTTVYVDDIIVVKNVP